MARSREHAYQVREALVRPAMPQNSWPTVQISSTALADAELSAVVMIGIEPPPPALISLMCVAAKSSASRTNQPAMAEKNTERQTPCDAEIAASRVSSAVCAEAS